MEAFVLWATESGYRRDLSIDRIDPDGDYSPSNCRWIPLLDNVRRKRDVVMTPNIVREIRSQLGKVSQRSIAAKYGVSRFAIYAIKTGRTWADVHDDGQAV